MRRPAGVTGSGSIRVPRRPTQKARMSRAFTNLCDPSTNTRIACHAGGRGFESRRSRSPQERITAQAKSVGGLAEPAGEVVVQVLLIVADPGDVAVGA